MVPRPVDMAIGRLRVDAVRGAVRTDYGLNDTDVIHTPWSTCRPAVTTPVRPVAARVAAA
ncbi:hypothetical protein SAMN05660324_1578 [Klenkia brasiliensis]|uniref:Uncharacterized protein n=1 Tax=Klenkia brasiliensis TaxID=333142 RepID=A0A1G7QQF4_9ACTN|nr:hypothetical protein SAMN05660324_1578 [Klenkia brasiliensis]